MENEKEQMEQLQTVLTNLDEWLIKFGYISNHAHNRVIEELSKELKIKPGNIEYLVDMENRRVEIRLYVSIWYLLFLTIFRRRDKVLNKAITLVSEILQGYEVRAVLARRGRRAKDHKLINSRPLDKSEIYGDPSKLPDPQNLLPDNGQQSTPQQKVRNEPVKQNSRGSGETQGSS